MRGAGRGRERDVSAQSRPGVCSGLASPPLGRRHPTTPGAPGPWQPVRVQRKEAPCSAAPYFVPVSSSSFVPTETDDATARWPQGRLPGASAPPMAAPPAACGPDHKVSEKARAAGTGAPVLVWTGTQRQPPQRASCGMRPPPRILQQLGESQTDLGPEGVGSG